MMQRPAPPVQHRAHKRHAAAHHVEEVEAAQPPGSRREAAGRAQDLHGVVCAQLQAGVGGGCGRGQLQQGGCHVIGAVAADGGCAVAEQGRATQHRLGCVDRQGVVKGMAFRIM